MFNLQTLWQNQLIKTRKYKGPWVLQQGGKSREFQLCWKANQNKFNYLPVVYRRAWLPSGRRDPIMRHGSKIFWSRGISRCWLFSEKAFRIPRNYFSLNFVSFDFVQCKTVKHFRFIISLTKSTGEMRALKGSGNMKKNQIKSARDTRILLWKPRYWTLCYQFNTSAVRAPIVKNRAC